MASYDRMVNTEKLIVEVEQRTPIWNSTLKEYGDKRIRKKLWDEIVKKFGGDEMKVQERKDFVIQLQKKWKNLRDSYFREIRRLRNVRRGSAVPKKTTYIYFKELSFLKIATDNASSTSSNVEQREDPEPPPTSKDGQESENDYHQQYKKKRNIDDAVAMEMVNVLKSSISAREERSKYNSDKLFLLSLLDDFRKIPDSYKSRAKIELLKLIQKYQASYISNQNEAFELQCNYNQATGSKSQQGYNLRTQSGITDYSTQSPESVDSHNSEY